MVRRTVDGLLDELVERYPALMVTRETVHAAWSLLDTCVQAEGVIWTCGNGGSCADAEHLTGELVKGFRCRRELGPDDKERVRSAGGVEGERLAAVLQGGIRAVALTGNGAVASAVANDMGGEWVYAQQVWALGRRGDVLVCLSTSGRARNVLLAVAAAQARGLGTIGLTGEEGGPLAAAVDVAIRVPAIATHEVQELHLPVYHALAAMLEASAFG